MVHKGGSAVASHSIAERVRWVQRWLHTQGVQRNIPRPHVAEGEYKRWRKERQELFWRPATHLFPFDASMRAAGWESSLAATNKAARKGIVWEPTPEGYWFLADLPGSGVYCRSPHPDNFAMGNLIWEDARDIMASKGMLLASVEELPIIWAMRPKVAPIPKDKASIVWLRTRCGKDRAMYFDEEHGAIDHSEDGFHGIAQFTVLIVGARGVRKIPNAS